MKQQTQYEILKQFNSFDKDENAWDLAINDIIGVAHYSEKGEMRFRNFTFRWEQRYYRSGWTRAFFCEVVSSTHVEIQY